MGNKVVIVDFSCDLREISMERQIDINSRRVARVLLMWKHFQAGGLGALNGSGRSPGGGPGAKPRKLVDFTHLQSSFLC